MSKVGTRIPLMKKLLKLSVYARNSDKYRGKNISDVLLDLFKHHGISGATILQGVRGYGVRGSSRVDVLGLSVNLPIVVEVIDEPQKIESLLPEMKTIMGVNGLVTLQEISVL
jgi:uncharacterized protein